MIIDNINAWNSPVRKITAKVELYEGSTQAALYSDRDNLKSFTIEKLGEESKFFGFGVCQKLNLHLIDTKRELSFGTHHSWKCYLNSGIDLDPFPSFKITEVHRDENTNELSITAYDALYDAAAHTVAELNLAAPYTILDVANACANLLGIASITILGVPTEGNPFDTSYPEGANLDGAETIREILNAIAEATQTIYYIDYNDTLVFKRPDVKGEAVLTISKADYITLNSKTNRRLSDICSATELGDNVITNSGITGTIQYVRDNPFWELRDDITTLLENALAAIGGLTINQFECSWRGNPALEIGDKIALVTKDDETVISYVLDDVVEYTGGLAQTTRWSFTDNKEESTDNPVTLGAALKKTFAKVDKANKEIEIVAAETEANYTELKMDTESIRTTVSSTSEILNDEINSLTTKVENSMTTEEIEFLISEELANGVERVTTSTGFTFNEEGLSVTKTNSEMSTEITEDGISVYRKNKKVLEANNLGVKAEDLHATTFLIIGKNSRLEDYNSNRTGCFWIG